MFLSILTRCLIASVGLATPAARLGIDTGTDAVNAIAH